MKVFLLLILGLTTNAFSQIEWSKHTIDPNLESATTLRTFDAENDGDIDIICSSYNVAWYENDGSQNFVQHTITPNDIAATSVDTIDWEGDGDVDLIADAAIDNRLYWYENDGHGQFTPHLIYANDNASFESWATYSVHAMDMDGDGDMDALHGGWEDPVIYWHENNGSDTNFTTHIVDTLGERSTVIANDLDGDNDIDIIVTCQYPSLVIWYENDGQQNFIKHIISDTNSRPRNLNIIDMEKDGYNDIVTANYADNIAWFENDGQKNFIPHFIPGSPTANTLHVVDLDNDNDWDILSGDPDNNNADSRFGWLENDGQQNFTYHNITYDLLWSSSVWADDVDLDGDIDVLFSDLIGDKIVWYESNLNDPVSLDEDEKGPLNFNLSQNYPNPFNPSTTIKFSLPKSSLVKLKVFDLLGKEVATLIDTHRPAGSHTVRFDASALATGLYYYTLNAGDFKQTRKMLLIR